MPWIYSNSRRITYAKLLNSVEEAESLWMAPPLLREDKCKSSHAAKGIKRLTSLMLLVPTIDTVAPPLAAHRLHSAAVGQAVLLIKSGGIQGKRIEERRMALWNNGGVRRVEHIPNRPYCLCPDRGPGRTAKREVFRQHLLDGIEMVNGE